MTRKELILDKNIKVIYNKLENIKLNQGYVDLSSSSIQNKNDLVDVCNIFRDPRYETFRIFYMKDNKIVGQEAITSKLPDGVFVFNEKTGDPIRTYEKMTNRMKRLNADGYYLAHNHPSGIAKASKEDMEVTKNFAANVEGFLGHIIIGSANRYSIIEEDQEGRACCGRVGKEDRADGNKTQGTRLHPVHSRERIEHGTHHRGYLHQEGARRGGGKVGATLGRT